MKHTFHAPPESVTGSTILFPEKEAHHAIRVMRVKTGDEAAVIDGIGNWYAVTLEVHGRKGLVGTVADHRESVGEPSYDLTVAVGLLKNGARFETFLEKAVELGASRVVPLITKRSERSRLKMKRAEMILVSAMKQCGRSRLLELSEPVKIRRWLKERNDGDDLFRAICHESAPLEQNLVSALKPVFTDKAVEIMIGPEGGFDDEELGQSIRSGFRIVSLGPRRFRTETAAILATTAVMNRFLPD